VQNPHGEHIGWRHADVPRIGVARGLPALPGTNGRATQQGHATVAAGARFEQGDRHAARLNFPLEVDFNATEDTAAGLVFGYYDGAVLDVILKTDCDDEGSERHHAMATGNVEPVAGIFEPDADLVIGIGVPDAHPAWQTSGIQDGLFEARHQMEQSSTNIAHPAPLINQARRSGGWPCTNPADNLLSIALPREAEIVLGLQPEPGLRRHAKIGSKP